jgi:glycosidase
MDPILEFHLTKRARQKYQFDETLFATDGRLVFADLAAARRFVARIHAVSGRLVPASDVYAMGLIDEILHLLVRHYEMENPGLMSRALAFVREGLGERLEAVLVRFTDEFPPQAVYQARESIQDYLAGSTEGLPHRRVSLEEMMLVNLANHNPALEPYREFFDDSVLSETAYEDAIRLLADFLGRQPGLGGGPAGRAGGTLVEVLAAPAKASPYSLEGQLQFLFNRWSALLGEAFVQRILRSIDFLKEEVFRQAGPFDFHPTAEVPTYGRDYPEYERYSTDRDWMPRLVLIAKNSYVWLEQLSRKYQRWIRTLDQIPDEELDLLARRGFTGLWLIGLWERSRASQKIKQRMGDSEAVASAYSLHSYDIAPDLGGWEALNNLRGRAWGRGIRLSADMVPNHMGIDANWVIEHPDWFLSRSHPPYPSYAYNSEDLSEDSRVGIFLEDHYYSRTDAAVVFKRLDRHTGDVRYIYHGNDGTSFPWNDTAQLDYTKAEVREAVIQTILHVARNFPVIRFDAAMTLAKKHIQRLWFPEPGMGGAVPSRAEFGMSRARFDELVPQEFWREVVDRVAAEVPDTLLLAEAFWLMEGYFVRTLGMHRVYNSAFMHMLRDEDNAKYRQAIKNTLEFDPQILKRYVNFMNNPDEKTAVEQFGNGDKYFGVATLLSTLPGLPMFGHGQVEGLREKYGMEFRKPKLDESPDEALVRGHEWKIFPLLHRRALFAGVEQFLLYDFYKSSGRVDENVFAFSNGLGDALAGAGERGLVIYHNKYADTRGWIKLSAAYLERDSGDLRQKSLGEGLGLPYDGHVIFKDHVTRLEYIRSCAEVWEKGLYLELGAYQHHAFMDFRTVEDDRWAMVREALNGAGVESVQARWDEMFGGKARPEEGRGADSGLQKAREGKAKKSRPKAAQKKTAQSNRKAVAAPKPEVRKLGPAAKKKPARTQAAAKKKTVAKKARVPKAKSPSTKTSVKKGTKTGRKKGGG